VALLLPFLGVPRSVLGFAVARKNLNERKLGANLRKLQFSKKTDSRLHI
jgi:hypothetical protein